MAKTLLDRLEHARKAENLREFAKADFKTSPALQKVFADVREYQGFLAKNLKGYKRVEGIVKEYGKKRAEAWLIRDWTKARKKMY